MSPYLPVEIKKGKKFKVYVESKTKMVASKAHVLRLALKEALKDELHVTEIDFIPATFVLQMHGWVSREDDPFRSCAKMKAFALKQIRAGRDPIRVLEKKGIGKWHYDGRVLKKSAPVWWGFTNFSAPWLGTAEKKAMGTVKGIQVITKAGRKTTKWLAAQAKEKGVEMKEKADRLFWMKVKCGYWPPGSTANPTRFQHAYMILIDSGRCVIHRREADFTDVSFLGTLLKGRYFNRLVERKLKEDEDAKKKTAVNYYFWKAKKGQFSETLMRQVAKGDIELSPLSAVKAAKGKVPEKG